MKAGGSSPTDSGAERRSTLFHVLLAATLLVFILTFKLLSPIFLSLLLILLISFAVNPVIGWLRVWTGGRRSAAALLTVGVMVVMGLTVWVCFVPIKDSVSKFANQVPEYWERLQKPLIKLEQKAVTSEKKLQAEVTTEIEREKVAAGEIEPEPAAAETPLPEPELAWKPEPEPEPESEAEPETAMGSVRANMGQMVEGVFGRFTSVAFNGAQILVVLVTVFFGVIYTLMSPLPIFNAVFGLVPDRHHDQALTIVRRIGDFVPRWAGATLAAMVVIGLLVFLLMWFFFGFTDALVLGLIAGIFAAIPFLGPLLSAVPALLLAFAEGGLTPLWVALAYLGIQAVENNVITPMIMAQGMKLHPLAVIFSMLLCVAAFGVLGVLVAAPLVAIVIILHDEIYRKRFLPGTTDADLDRLSQRALREKVSTNP